MTRILLALVLLVGTVVTTSAQLLQPAKMTAKLSKTEVAVGEVVDVIYTATIDDNWYIYTIGFDADCGPNPTEITIEPDPSFELVGKLKAINDVQKHDKIFDCDVRYFTKTGEFRQSVRIKSANLKLSSYYEGQTCSELNGKCVLFDGKADITGITVKGGPKTNKQEEQQPKEEQKEESQQEKPKEESSIIPTVPDTKSDSFNGPVLDKSVLDGESTINDGSFFGYLVLAFVLGLTSLLTPCVFPMIPMTVSFFFRDNQTKREGIRKAIVFGLSIIVIYTLAGSLFAVLLGPEGLNALSTHWAPNLFVFVIFIAFALSFFGLYEINAPNALVNRADRQADKGGLTGIFFMAATLVLVSFSCTIPIVGNVIVLAAGGQILKPVLSMFSYSLAFAIPFTVFAFFPEWIKSLPKSGGWLNNVKVTLGFLELAFCLKFFSIADQAYHWGLLDREINIGLWVVLFTMLGFYFLGKLPMKGDSPVQGVTVPRLLLSSATFAFVIYLIPGLFGAPLKALAGYLPPLYTHDFNLLEAKNEQAIESEGCQAPKYADFLHLPHGLSGYFDYKQALQCAREQKKPLFIDFTGHGCTNCREMEANVWNDPQVLTRLKNDFVVVALYVDDKTALPESEWFTSKHDGTVKKTIGKQNADLQITNLENNAQPFYVLVGADEKVLAWPYGYNRDVNEFVKFLDSGKNKYKSLYGGSFAIAN